MSCADARGREAPLSSLELPQYLPWLDLPSFTVKASIFRTPAVFRCAQMSSAKKGKSHHILSWPFLLST